MNRSTRIIVSTFGVLLSIAGLNHGFFEALQGNTPATGPIIQAIGGAQRMWVHGTEEAFTIVPNFLVTGLLAMMVAIAILVWSVGFVHRQHGPAVFILLFVLLFLVGGGIGQIVFFTLAWAGATRINQPLSWWRRVLPETLQPGLAKLWPAALVAGTLSFLIALEIAIFGILPGASDPEQILHICWSFLLAGFGVFCVAFVSGFADDLQKRRALAA